MRKVLAAGALVLAWAQPSAAQPSEPQADVVTMGIAGGPRKYLSGTRRRTAVVQLFVRVPMNRWFALEGELAGGSGSDGDIHLPPADGVPAVVVTHFAADLGLNLVFRTPGRVGFVATVGPGVYIEQRDSEVRGEGTNTPDVVGRNNDYTLGVQGSAGVDVSIGRGALFSVLRLESRAVRAPVKRANWQVLTGVRFPLWF
jgi:hypothetical protein